MKCTRIGGCLKELTKTWAHPQECACEIQEKLERHSRERTNAIERKKHLSDIAFVNQNARGR